MDVWVMVVIGAGLFVLPFVLMLAYNRGDRSDSRGRRVNRRWHS